MKNLSKILISIVYLPIVTIAWMTFGLICGILGSIVGTFEFIYFQFRQRYKLWKRFPKESLELWSRLNKEFRDKNIKRDKQLYGITEVKEEKDPHPVVHLLIYLAWGIGLFPFRVIVYSLTGPIIGFVYAIDQWQEKILKMSIEKRIDYKFKTHMEEELSWISREEE